MPTSLHKKRWRRWWLLGILILRGAFDTVRLLCEMGSFYDDPMKLVEGDFTTEELDVSEKVDDFYRLYDASDDPSDDMSGVCAVTDIKENDFVMAAAEISVAMATWRGI